VPLVSSSGRRVAPPRPLVSAIRSRPASRGAARTAGSAPKAPKTVAEFIETWWQRYAMVRLEPSTRDGYARVWEKHLRPTLGGYRLRDVTPAVVDRLASELLEAGV
jgi:integrase